MEEDQGHWLPPVEDRHAMEYRTDDVFSRVSRNGTYGIDLVRSIYVEIPEIEASDVIVTVISAPCLRNSLAKRTVSTAAIPPVTTRCTILPLRESPDS